jgi:hypothetical protein
MAAKPPPSGRVLRDLVELTKPGVTRMCALTTAGGAWLAPGFEWLPALAGVLGASLAVAGASALNMWLERGKDPLMARTRARPLATRRLPERTGLAFAIGLCALALAVLWLFTNPLTAVLAAWAIVGYALVYTPLKYRTPLALVIGAVPGAAPPLLGWTAVTGSIDPGRPRPVRDPAGLADAALPRDHAVSPGGLRPRGDPLRAGGPRRARDPDLQAILVVDRSGADLPLPTVIGLTGWLYGAIALAAQPRCSSGGRLHRPRKLREIATQPLGPLASSSRRSSTSRP